MEEEVKRKGRGKKGRDGGREKRRRGKKGRDGGKEKRERGKKGGYR